MKIWKQKIAPIIAYLLWSLMPDLVLAGQQFTYLPPRDLSPGSGSYLSPNFADLSYLRFPLEGGPAYANSQVYNPGGQYGSMSVYSYGVNVSDAPNFDYPWRDNYCETRSYQTPYCTSGTGHQGQDIRPATYADDTYWVVAVENGIVMNANPFSSEVRIDVGNPLVRRYFYRHMKSIQVSVGQTVAVGQRLGRVSNIFGGTPTVYHLHLEMMMTIGGVFDLVPPYPFLVHAYERLIGQTGIQMYQSGQVVYAASALDVLGAPGVGVTLGTVGPSTKGTVVSGPTEAGPYTWFQVSWVTGVTGWVKDFLLISRFNTGDRVEASGISGTPMSSAVGGSPFVTMPNGSTGSILTDVISTYLGGVHLWRRIRWDTGQEGWVEEYYLKTSASTSCSATLTYMAKKRFLPRALALQCGGGGGSSSPTPTTDTMSGVTPTWTPVVQGMPTLTPTKLPVATSTLTGTPTRIPTTTYTATATPTSTPTPGTLIFQDDFNRPDSSMAGNGWFGLPPALFIQSNRLVGGGIATHEMPFQFPLRFKVRLFAGGCGTEGSATNHFDHQISILTDAYGSGGLGLYFFRADQNVSTSQINLMNGGVLLDRIIAPVDFTDTVDVDATVFADGSVKGSYRSQGIETPFAFPARVLDVRGSSVALRSYWICPENYLSFDDVVIEAITPPTATPTAISTTTASPTTVFTPSPTVPRTASPTVTRTNVPIPTATAVFTATATSVNTATLTRTFTPTTTRTPTPTRTQTTTTTITFTPTATLTRRIVVRCEKTTPLNVRFAPLISAAVIGFQGAGATGMIIGNRQYDQIGGYWFSYVDFDSGVDGWVVDWWVVDPYLVTSPCFTIITTPMKTATPTPTPTATPTRQSTDNHDAYHYGDRVGVRCKTIPLNVRGDPWVGAPVIGTVPVGSRGTIVSQAVLDSVGDSTGPYWFQEVDWDNPLYQDGWVVIYWLLPESQIIAITCK